MIDDYLSRKPYINLLKSIIDNQSKNDNGYAFAIDGEWGCGKTWILNELEKQLSENKEYLFFHYNAWENDFYEEPLVAILSVLIDKLNEITKQKNFYESTIDVLLNEALNDLKLLVCGIVHEVTKIDLEKSIEHKKGLFKRIKQGTKITTKELDNLIPLKNTLKVVRNNILKLSDKLNIILVVDELDRCLPEYAIKVLERLHHICNGMPVIQIMAINKIHFNDNILKVFGKNFNDTEKSLSYNEQFVDSYLEKFFDTIIPIPDSILDKRLEVLNGLEKEFEKYIRTDNIGRPFINLDEEFLAEFISSIMNGVERRLQEKIFKQVSLCHELTLNSGIQYEKEHITYAFLIYEIISCIGKFVFHTKEPFAIREIENQQIILLSLYPFPGTTKDAYKQRYNKINSNIEKFFNVPMHPVPKGIYDDKLFIRNTKTYLMAFFINKPDFPYVTFESYVWDWIRDDKDFLNKYDEIMDMIIKR